MNTRTRSDAGFTIIELIVVALLGTVLIGAVFQVLTINQRAYTLQGAEMRTQGAVRASADVLFGELREISPEQGDIIDMKPNSIEVRVGRGHGLICQFDVTGVPQVTIVNSALQLATGDSVFVLSDNNITISTDDVWLSGRVSAASAPGVCNGLGSQTIWLSGMEADIAANPISTGSLVRGFEHVKYSLLLVDGEWYLGQQVSGGSTQPVAGPLLPAGGKGLEFTYLDEFGVVTVDPLLVSRIDVVLRSASVVHNVNTGAAVSDSLVFQIQTRN